MRIGIRGFSLAIAGLALIAFHCGEAAAQSQSGPQMQVVPLSSEELYDGWSASELIGQDVVSRAGASLGNHAERLSSAMIISNQTPERGGASA